MQNKFSTILVYGSIVWSLLLQLLFLAETVNPNVYFSYGKIISYAAIASSFALYIVCAILVWIEMKELKDFQIDKFTIITLLLGSILRQRLQIWGGNVVLILVGIIGVLLAITLITRRPYFIPTNVRWTIIAAIIGGLLVVIITFVQISLRQSWTLTPLLRNSFGWSISNLMVRELYSTAVLEEILFRGFLWGFLSRKGWSSKRTMWTQGVLFWLTHLGRLSTPFSFFVVIPLLTIISTKLTSHTKQVFPAVISHTVINVLTALLNLATY